MILTSLQKVEEPGPSVQARTCATARERDPSTYRGYHIIDTLSSAHARERAPAFPAPVYHGVPEPAVLAHTDTYEPYSPSSPSYAYEPEPAVPAHADMADIYEPYSPSYPYESEPAVPAHMSSYERYSPSYTHKPVAKPVSLESHRYDAPVYDVKFSLNKALATDLGTWERVDTVWPNYGQYVAAVCRRRIGSWWDLVVEDGWRERFVTQPPCYAVKVEIQYESGEGISARTVKDGRGVRLRMVERVAEEMLGEARGRLFEPGTCRNPSMVPVFRYFC